MKYVISSIHSYPCGGIGRHKWFKPIFQLECGFKSRQGYSTLVAE